MSNTAHPIRKQTVERFYLAPEPTNISDIVYKVAACIQPMVNSRKQSLNLDVTPYLPEVIADSLRIEQVLLHLLSNAIKLTPDGGCISLSASTKGSVIVIEVKDSGPNILPKEPQEIFQPHYRLESDDAADSPGIGLGLALCKFLVELHGGAIWVEGEEGKANTFAFSLPF